MAHRLCAPFHTSARLLWSQLSRGTWTGARVFQETQRLSAEPVPGISATPYEDNLRYFNVAIAGPSDSPFEGGLFRLELFLPADYPMAPPKVGGLRVCELASLAPLVCCLGISPGGHWVR